MDVECMFVIFIKQILLCQHRFMVFFYHINIDKPRRKSRIPALPEHPEAQTSILSIKRIDFMKKNNLFEINRNKYNLCHFYTVLFAHSMMLFKSSRREHLFVLFRVQWVLLGSSWNKHVAVNFKDGNMGAIKCKKAKLLVKLSMY